MNRRIEEAKGTFKFEDKETVTLTTFAQSTDILKKICREAMKLCLNEEDGCISVFVPDKYGNVWIRALTKTKRHLSSVILDGSLSDNIVRDIQSFIKSKSWYEEKGLPYRRGYLFYGPPGCGKSSFLFALASQLELNVCCLSLAERTISDAVLNDLLRKVPRNAAVLLEDVDSAFTDRNSVGDKTGVTFSGLLNALDGIAAHEGRLLFMTTNHKERLDAALIRPGRCDGQIYFGLASKYQMAKLFLAFYPGEEELAEKFLEKIPANKFSMAQLQGHFLNYKDQPQKAVDMTQELLDEQLNVGQSL